MKIMVTGAGGFIGSHLMDALRDEHSIWGFDNFLTGREENCRMNRHVGDVGGEVQRMDITERDVLYPVANVVPPEVVIHCAASYSDPDKWHRDTDTNVAGGINAAAIAKHHGAHLIYFQTILPPVSSYAISKIAAEQYMRLSGVPLTVLRLGNIYGPRNLSGPIPVFYKRITEGKPCLVVDTTRDMVFIDDLVRCVKTVVENRLEGTFDVCSGEQTPIMQMWEEVSKWVDGDHFATLLPPDPDDVQGSISLENALASWKWQPRMSLSEGIGLTCASYNQRGIDQTYTHLRIGEKDAS